MTIIKRVGLGRPLEWSELDGNFSQVGESTIAAQQAASLASAAQQAAATSATDAAASASEASSQAAAASVLRADLASTDAGKGLSLSVAEDGTNGQQFYEKADKFAGAYEDGIINITSVNSWITYNGDRWYVKPGTAVPFTTTGLNATSWETDSSNFTSPSYGIGEVLPDAVAIFTIVNNYSSIRVRGFYSANDGGHGVWVTTGNIDTTKSGTHVPATANIYNANGVEYVLLTQQGQEISVAANGAKSCTYAEANDKTTDDFVCLGEVFNGILSTIPDVVYMGNTDANSSYFPRLEITVPGKIYRIGKNSVRMKSKVKYNLGNSTIYVMASKSRAYSATGTLLNGFEHGYDEIKTKWVAEGKNSYWGSVSLQHVTISGGLLVGDQLPTTAVESCSSGVGVLVLNPEYVHLDNVDIGYFNWCAVGVPSQLAPTSFYTYGNAFDDNTKDYVYILDYMVDAGVTSRFGNFYGFNSDNCRFHTGRRGVYRNGCDWSYVKGGLINNDKNWLASTNVSGTIPEYVGVVTGTAFNFCGGYTGTAANKGFNVGKSTWYTTAHKHTFENLYVEWTYCAFTISALGMNDTSARVFGLHLSNISGYKDDLNNYKIVRFEDGSFGTISDDGTYVLPTSFHHFDTFYGLQNLSIDTPVRDAGAFRHEGFDFKYGMYNVAVSSGCDFEILRDTPYAKEMFNAYGVQVNSGTIKLPWQSPAFRSSICIWIKDLTGSFDVSNIYAWLTQAGYENSSETDEARYKSFAESVIDFGNGYKLLTLDNKRFSAYDGLYAYSPNSGIVFNVPATTPIVIKAVEAYQGGVPFFPTGCSYIPESTALEFINSNTNEVSGFDSSLGGGLFKPGDIVNPTAYVRRSKSGYTISTSVGSRYSGQTRIVNGGVSLPDAFKVSFTATISSVDSINGLTVISIPTTDLPYLCVGVPIYVSSGSSTSYTGAANLLKRNLTSAGVADTTYTVIGVIGAAGDSLTIDQSKLASYVFLNAPVNASTISGTTITGDNVAVSSGVTLGASGGKNTSVLFYGSSTSTPDSGIYSSYAGTVGYLNFTSNHLLVNSLELRPTTDNSTVLGSASYRFSSIYAANSTISTSNKTKKTNFRQISDVEVNAFYEIGKLDSVWQWLEKYQSEGDKARLHSGPTVQDAIDVMTKYGLDWNDYAAFCYDSWGASDAIIETWEAEYDITPAIPAVTDDNGTVITPEVPEVKTLIRSAGERVIVPAAEAGEEYAFRKEELLFWILRATIAKQVNIDSRLSALESKSSR